MKLKTVTIGIAVYNEEKSIAKLLSQLLKQKNTNHRIEKIIVYSDGSTDNTPQVVEHFISTHRNSPVQLKLDRKNKGRATRLKQLYNLNQSDILIILDGDVHIPDTNTVNILVNGFSDPNIGIVSSNNQPIEPNTLLGKVWWAAELFWYEVRRDYKGGNNLYNNSGCGVALEKNFAKKILMPPATIADHQFVYLSSIVEKKDFVFASKAIVYYHPPATWRDIMNQYRRSLSEEDFLSQHFDTALNAHFEVSAEQKRKGLIRSLRQRPVLTVLALTVLKMLPLIPLATDPNAATGRWQRTDSTKK